VFELTGAANIEVAGGPPKREPAYLSVAPPNKLVAGFASVFFYSLKSEF